jgi:Fe-S cluster assembly ATP-binding protein
MEKYLIQVFYNSDETTFSLSKNSTILKLLQFIEISFDELKNSSYQLIFKQINLKSMPSNEKLLNIFEDDALQNENKILLNILSSPNGNNSNNEINYYLNISCLYKNKKSYFKISPLLNFQKFKFNILSLFPDLDQENYQIIYNNEDITKMSIEKRAKKGIYLLSQSPIAIEGVTNAEMLRLAVSEKTGKGVDIFKFNKELESICEKLELDKKFIHKEINVGASGGERKKIELMHMWMLKPSLIILDEIDSGLDVDATKLVANSIKEYFNMYKPIIIIITHNKMLINEFDNYYVHLFEDEKLLQSGDKELASEILNKGFKEIHNTFVMKEKE